ncbi:hypothetical protein LTR86_011103 [Recurvomyces mirabilis]|nr:hypothetical protein LTR86_011103 [Recurvomyces mirabilis]
MAASYGPTLSKDAAYDDLRTAPVFACRIGVQNLGLQRHFYSENHVTLYLLVGSGQSVRVDMRPRAGRPRTDLAGALELRGHTYTRSNGIIRYVDVPANGCPLGFQPDGRGPQPGRDTRRVSDFVQLLRSNRLHRYRFLNVNGGGLGCRYWVLRVMSLFQKSGYLYPGVNLSQAPAGQVSLLTLLSHQWDSRLGDVPGKQLTMIPGLFVCQDPVSMNPTQVYQRIAAAQNPALLCLFDSLATQHQDIAPSRVYLTISSPQGQAIRTNILGVLAQRANNQGLEGATANEMTRTPVSELDILYTALQGRYEAGRIAIHEAKRFRQSSAAQNHTNDIFTLYLAAVCNLAGEEDREERDEDDDDDDDDD